MILRGTFRRKKNIKSNEEEDAPKMKDDSHDSLLPLNNLDIHKEQHLQPEEELTFQKLAELLQVQPNSEQQSQKQAAVHLMEIFVSQHFPKPPADLDQNLQQHLVDVQDTVLDELVRLVPLLDEHLMGDLMNCYHCHTFKHLDCLLQNISSSQNYFMLMKWSLKTYLSQELLGHPDLQKIDPIKKVDLLLWTEWAAKAKDKLLDNMQKEVRDSLENVLQNERTLEQCASEEAFVRLYVDTIQCIDAMNKAAEEISSKLSDYVREVNFQELLTFVKRYSTEQTEVLKRKATMNQPNTILFFKTLKACKELKQHVQTKGTGTSPFEETVETLNNMEDFTLKLLLDVVSNITEKHLEKYFKSDNRGFSVFTVVVTHFPKLSYGLDEQERVMDKAYKLIVRIYIKHLIQTNKSKLEKCWSPNVGQTVKDDAQQLHHTISELAPGVKQWNLILLKISDLLNCKCNEALKLTAADIQHNCLTSEDSELLPTLLKWKGLSNGKIKEVLHVVHHDHHSTTTSGFWYSSLTCW